METKIKWNEGEGYITATYEGSGNGSASISSDVNEGIDREQSIKVETTDKSVSATLLVSQEGLREEFVTSDEKVFMTADGEVFGVLKHVEHVNPILTDYLTLVALEDGFSTSLSLNTCEYCVDGDGNWVTLAANTATTTINTGQTLSFRGNLTPTSSNGIGTFTLNKKCKLRGNAMSMLFGDDAKNNMSLVNHQYAFMGLFYNNPNLIEVADDVFTATELSLGCYRRMFQSCTGLIKIPSILPAKTLDQHCYRDMFRGCSAITEAPILPARTLHAYCYSYMFYYCSALNKVTALFTELSPSTATQYWLQGVASSGTFIKSSDANWTTSGVNGVPSGWTIIKE